MKIDKTGKPMMSDDEIQIIHGILIETSSRCSCLEWGSGNSTITFPQMFFENEHWVSIEHNGHYIDYLAPKVPSSIVTLVWVQDTADYVDCVKKNKAHYDFILIDGISEQREKCLEASFDMIKDDGVVLLHDWHRKEYADFIEKSKFPRKEILTEGEIPDEKNPGFFIHRGLMAFYKK